MVTKPLHLLHDVGGKHDALALLVAQPPQRVAQRAGRQHVQAVGGFSQGERMKTALARALVHDPANIVLDEPTNGLDVLATRALRDTLRRLRDEHGKCIVFSTHIMQEVERLCDHVVVVAHGRTVAAGSVAALLAQAQCSDFEEAFVKLGFEPLFEPLIEPLFEPLSAQPGSRP